MLCTLETPNPGAGSNANFGSALAMGDATGDGRAEILVGGRFEDVDAVADQGRAYLFRFDGGTGSCPLMRTLDMTIPQADSNFGQSVAMGDVDGDGQADTAVGANRENVNGSGDRGRAYIFSGANGTLLCSVTTPTPQADAYFGSAIAMGDATDDGGADVLVAANGEDSGGTVVDTGRAHLFTYDVPTDSCPLVLSLDTPNPTPGALFGDFAAMGDATGDGAADMIIGSSNEDVPGTPGQGRAYLFAGVSGGLLCTLESPSPAATRFGEAVAMGDTTADGRAEIAVGALFEDVGSNPDEGRAYLFAYDVLTATCPLLQAVNTPIPQAEAHFSHSLALGDADADGRDDLLVGAVREDVAGNVDQGRVYVFCLNPAEADGDTFTDCEERWVGTDETLPCSTDRWPADFDSNHIINISDVLALKPPFGSKYGDANYSRRHDITGDGSVNISDVLRMKPVFGMSCAP